MSVTPATIQIRVPATNPIIAPDTPTPCAAKSDRASRQYEPFPWVVQSESCRTPPVRFSFAPLLWPPASRAPPAIQALPDWQVRAALQIQPSPGKQLVGIHSMRSRHPCYRCAGLQRFLNDSTLLLHGAKSSPRLSTSHLYSLSGSVHDFPLWTRSLCPQRASFVPTHTSSRR